MEDGFRVVAIAPSSRKGKPPYRILENESGILFCPCDGFKWRGNCGHLKRYRTGELPPYNEDEVIIKAKIIFAHPGGTIDAISGVEVPLEAFKVGDLTDRVRETEEHLSRLTGLVVRIEMASE